MELLRRYMIAVGNEVEFVAKYLSVLLNEIVCDLSDAEINKIAKVEEKKKDADDDDKGPKAV